jgi:hypothetical protein
MEDEIRPRRQIDAFARELVRIYGFTGVEAEQERVALASALVAG